MSASSPRRPLELHVIHGSAQSLFTTSTLVIGQKDAVLIDAGFTLADAHRIIGAVLDSGKNLTTVYVTHAHPDHYFGFALVHAAFPNAKLVALPATVAAATATWKASLAKWKPTSGANLTDAPVLPEALTGNTLTLEGETLQVTGAVQGDDVNNSYVWVPSLKAVIAGDIVFNGVHVWTASTKAPARQAWLKTLDALDALKPAIVVAGHGTPDAKDDATALAFTRDYLKAFDAAVSSSKNAGQISWRACEPGTRRLRSRTSRSSAPKRSSRNRR